MGCVVGWLKYRASSGAMERDAHVPAVGLWVLAQPLVAPCRQLSMAARASALLCQPPASMPPPCSYDYAANMHSSDWERIEEQEPLHGTAVVAEAVATSDGATVLEVSRRLFVLQQPCVCLLSKLPSSLHTCSAVANNSCPPNLQVVEVVETPGNDGVDISSTISPADNGSGRAPRAP